MKQMKILLPLLFLLMNPALWALSSEDHIREAGRLKEDGLYLSAWTYLHEHADEIDYSSMMISKTELCIRYYALTNLHRKFAFADLKPGETLEEIRKNPSGTESMKLFDPEGGLLSALEQDPENGKLHYWLGEYYFSLLHLFGQESGFSPEELRTRIMTQYRAALESGTDEESLYANLAYTELTAEEWNSAAVHFRTALEKDPEDPGYHYNLAMALMKTKQLEEADEEIRQALPLYGESPYTADTLFLGSTIALMRENEKDALAYLNQGKETAPRDYRFPDRLIQVHLVRSDKEAALENSRILFDLYPHNPESCQTIMKYFNAFNALADLVPFFENQIVRYAVDPEALGNLFYHEGVVYQRTGNPQDAISRLEQAKEVFHGIYPDDHQIFGIIENLLNQMDKG
jgi:tetratricopeptide (TPR) repeat protein